MSNGIRAELDFHLCTKCRLLGLPLGLFAHLSDLPTKPDAVKLENMSS